MRRFPKPGNEWQMFEGFVVLLGLRFGSDSLLPRVNAKTRRFVSEAYLGAWQRALTKE